jgi:hypothetical protein
VARSYARIITAIWRNKEFRRLRGAAQRVYLLLVTQPDISAAGTLPLTVRRWADLDADTTAPDIVNALEELETGRFIAMDRTTEELLVRSFVKWDGGYGNRKRRPVIESAGLAIDSYRLRRVLAMECERLGFTIDGLIETPDGSDDPPPSTPEESSNTQVDRLSDSVSDGHADGTSRSDRVVVGYVSTEEPTTLNPQPVPPPAGAGAQQIIATWIDGCRKRPPKQVIGIISKNVKALLEEGVDTADVQAGLQRWADKGSLHPSTLPTVVNEVMNRPVTFNGYASATDANIAALLSGNGQQPQPLRLLEGGSL